MPPTNWWTSFIAEDIRDVGFNIEEIEGVHRRSSLEQQGASTRNSACSSGGCLSARRTADPPLLVREQRELLAGPAASAVRAARAQLAERAVRLHIGFVARRTLHLFTGARGPDRSALRRYGRGSVARCRPSLPSSPPPRFNACGPISKPVQQLCKRSCRLLRPVPWRRACQQTRRVRNVRGARDDALPAFAPGYRGRRSS